MKNSPLLRDDRMVEHPHLWACRQVTANRAVITDSRGRIISTLLPLDCANELVREHNKLIGKEAA